MYQYQSHQDTIAAIATASGAGGVAIIRLSGSQSARILEGIFHAKFAGSPFSWKPNVLHYGRVKDPAGAMLDEALAVVMRAPKSYTAEDSVEIHTHGGASAARAVLGLCLAAGARLAEPGEFTKRAFLNGRIDLAQAEAVLDMVSARTELMLRAANHQLDGELSQELGSIREALMMVYSGLEAALNFPEDDAGHELPACWQKEMTTALGRINALLSTARQGIILREGMRVVICGKPNVGKSSLLNVLLKHPRAIVTDVAGTTRDTLEESANIKGIPVNLVDTAGILEPRDKVEAEAVRRSRESIASADIMLLVLDRSLPLDLTGLALVADGALSEVIIVLNKSDLPAMLELPAEIQARSVVEVSTLTRAGISVLEDLLVTCALKGALPDTNAVLLTNARHIEALRLAAQSLGQAAEMMDAATPAEIISDMIKVSVNHLDAVTGRNIDADAIDRIFATFCIGK